MNSESDNLDIIYCSDDYEYRTYCDMCDELCIERFHNNHLKPGTHVTKFRKRPQ